MKQLLYIFCFLLSADAVLGQAKQKPPVKPATTELKKLLGSTGLPFRLINDSLAIIPYEGKNIASYNVMVQRISELYIVYTNLTEALPGKIDDTKFKYLLQRNNDFDIIKTGIDSASNIVYLRADVYKAGMTSTVMTRLIKQIANVTNIVGGDLNQ
jgi:hypothetical protein